jgi:hypothetical protein
MVQSSSKPAPPENPNLEVRTGNGTPFSWFETGDIEYTLKMDHWQNDESYLEEIELSRGGVHHAQDPTRQDARDPGETRGRRIDIKVSQSKEREAMHHSSQPTGRPNQANLSEVDLSDPAIEKLLEFCQVARPCVKRRVMREMRQVAQETKMKNATERTIPSEEPIPLEKLLRIRERLFAALAACDEETAKALRAVRRRSGQK